MRTYTLFVSLVAHAGAIALVAVTTIVASDVLPPVKRALDWVVVTPEIPAPPPLRPRQVTRTEMPVAVTIPLEAPSGISAEKPVPPVDTSFERAGLLDGGVTDLPEVPDITPAPMEAKREAVRVGGAIQPPRKLFAPPPAYPEIARNARKDGIVILEAVIGEDGSVREVRLLRSIPLLDQAAIDAVRQWRFTPTLLNGAPVSVVMTVTVGFTLN